MFNRILNALNRGVSFAPYRTSIPVTANHQCQPGLLAAKLGICMAVTMASGCGWVESTGNESISLEEALDRQILTGSGDVVDIVAEEPVLLDTTALLSRVREGGNPVPTNAMWRQIGNSDLTQCPHLSQQPETGVSLRQACDLAAYGGNNVNAATDCSIHFVELADNPGVYEASTPAITHPVVLHYEVIATSSDGLSNASELTICLQPSL